MGLAAAPLAVISTVHTMGRTDDFGALGNWYVMLPLTLAAVLAWLLVEKAAGWVTRSDAGQTATGSVTRSDADQ